MSSSPYRVQKTQARGVSADALSMCDGRFTVPLSGLSESLRTQGVAQGSFVAPKSESGGIDTAGKAGLVHVTSRRCSSSERHSFQVVREL